MGKKIKNAPAASRDRITASDPLTPIPGVELFFGFVSPTGTNLDAVCRELTDQLRNMGYTSEVVSLSDLIKEFSGKDLPKDNEYERIRFLMGEGTRLRESTDQGDFVARLALVDIRRRRKAKTGNDKTPAERTAYILRSFKRKEEVELFRGLYGKAFNLISVYSSLDERLDSLSHKLARTSKKPVKSVQHQALELINTDAEEEGKALGQKVRDTFPLADYFVTVKDLRYLREQLSRLVQLIFGNPYLTPTRDEHAMFIAQASALRSGDLSRQVGAAIVTGEGEILSSGCNEVPKFSGGLYWADDPSPHRDLEIGHDKNAKIKREIVEELMHKLRAAKWLKDEIATRGDDDLYQSAALESDGFLRESQLLDVIEYGRSVHAEMAAITDAAKRGVSVDDARLFCTTFPCHLCARHIISSGIREVVYIEPYPKSRTDDLFSDSVAVNPKDAAQDKVNFFPFVGVAPRRYFDFFQATGKRKTDTGEVVDWENEIKNPRIKRFVLSYLLIEERIVESLPSPV